MPDQQPYATFMGEPMTEREQLIYRTAWSDGAESVKPLTDMQLRVGYKRPDRVGCPWIYPAPQPASNDGREGAE